VPERVLAALLGQLNFRLFLNKRIQSWFLLMVSLSLTHSIHIAVFAHMLDYFSNRVLHGQAFSKAIVGSSN